MPHDADARDFEQLAESLDGIDPHDADDASDGAGDALRARRPARTQGRRGVTHGHQDRSERATI